MSPSGMEQAPSSKAHDTGFGNSSNINEGCQSHLDYDEIRSNQEVIQSIPSICGSAFHVNAHFIDHNHDFELLDPKNDAKLVPDIDPYISGQINHINAVIPRDLHPSASSNTSTSSSAQSTPHLPNSYHMDSNNEQRALVTSNCVDHTPKMRFDYGESILKEKNFPSSEESGFKDPIISNVMLCLQREQDTGSQHSEIESQAPSDIAPCQVLNDTDNGNICVANEQILSSKMYQNDSELCIIDSLNTNANNSFMESNANICALNQMQRRNSIGDASLSQRPIESDIVERIGHELEDVACINGGIAGITHTLERRSSSSDIANQATNSACLRDESVLLLLSSSTSSISSSQIDKLKNNEQVEDKFVSNSLSIDRGLTNKHTQEVPIQVRIYDESIKGQQDSHDEKQDENRANNDDNYVGLDFKKSNTQSSQDTKSKQQSGSRFFPSKLNTGSLWSLLSGASGDIASDTSDKIGLANDLNNVKREAPIHQAASTSFSSNFFERAVQFSKRSQVQVESHWNELSSSNSDSNRSRVTNVLGHYPISVMGNRASRDTTTTTTTTATNANSQIGISTSKPDAGQQSSSGKNSKLKYKFPVKYVGSSMLHKNFTLPMLEWIAKDIRRHTLSKGSLRDVIFEIHSNLLVALNCRDGHRILVHPMDCVSKYVQLQLDQNCFAYIIRDSKESPKFAHVFQAKSSNKVHEIFSALREATSLLGGVHQIQPVGPMISTTKTSTITTTNTDILGKVTDSSQCNLDHQNRTHSSQKMGSDTIDDNKQTTDSDHSSIANRVPIQKSLSLDLAGQKSQRSQLGVCPDNQLIEEAQQIQSRQEDSRKQIQKSISISTREHQSSNPYVSSSNSECLNIDNSYQFEVMFVKRVKLNCRRVPASFVDDALETLKSFEVLKCGDSKSAQIKGKSRATIINASVDERQEYDEIQPHQSTQADDRGSSLENRRNSFADNINQNCSPESLTDNRSRSCQQTPTKDRSQHEGSKTQVEESTQHGSSHKYCNDFTPYSTITSSGLNERIAAIPVMSHGSVSLDHETRQRLARQVRQTIQAQAANIKKDVCSGGAELKSSSSLKVIDSLSCTVASNVPMLAGDLSNSAASCFDLQSPRVSADIDAGANDVNDEAEDDVKNQRRSSANLIERQYPGFMSANNFDLLRRASARQIIKNRTMLLLIGKQEICSISIDKHQLLFSKSFSQIMHCLQGSNNRDHFGLITRDSNKINPTAESYAGFIFKCQSEKVVREIMAALKQVIHNSQLNYHSHYSPYNNNLFLGSSIPITANTVSNKIGSLDKALNNGELIQNQSMGGIVSKRNSNLNPLDIGSTNRSQLLENSTTDSQISQHPATAPVGSPKENTFTNYMNNNSNKRKQMFSNKHNVIKTMFCDNCPLYWFHRLCSDIESLPSEASKAIILRRIDSSLSEKEQDDLYSKFSQHNIESIEEHNVIFMSLLRHLCESKQAKHASTSFHLEALAKNLNQLKQEHQQQSDLTGASHQSIKDKDLTQNRNVSGHRRSGSAGGSLVHNLILNTNADAASAAAMYNLKRAKNTISISIENMLKRRSSSSRDTDNKSSNPSLHDDNLDKSVQRPNSSSGFCHNDTSSTNNESEFDVNCSKREGNVGIKRSQSSHDSYGNLSRAFQSSMNQQTMSSWRDSFSRTIQMDDLVNPFAGLFKQRSSTFDEPIETNDVKNAYSRNDGFRSSTDSLSDVKTSTTLPNLGNRQNLCPSNETLHPSSSNSSMLSSVFWKKSLFDKIRLPDEGQTVTHPANGLARDVERVPRPNVSGSRSRTKQELRDLWKKAICEQITLLKMDKQNQRLVAGGTKNSKPIAPKVNQQLNTNQPMKILPNIATTSTTKLVPTEHLNLAPSKSPTPSDLNKLKLNYKAIPHSHEIQFAWKKLLKVDPNKKVEFVEVARLVRLGVPKHLRGEVWLFLMNQYQLRHGTNYQPDENFKGDANQPYRSLLSQLSVQQHEIFVDIGRTFPTHPYYSQYLCIGQLSLFNLLKAYSLLDPEVGYCQGLSFVAGILMLHVDTEDEAFELMRHLMFNFGLRHQYLPSMNALHLQLYQMTRLLRDHEHEIYNHFNNYDVSPTLYAAPWFLTLFASQFPLGFVSRLLDLLSLIGIEAIFRVSLMLLAHHRKSILACNGLEATMDFLKSELINIDEKDMGQIFEKSFGLDLRNELLEFEIEYTFYCAEDHKLKSSKPNNNQLMRLNRFDKSHETFRNTSETSIKKGSHEEKLENKNSTKDVAQVGPDNEQITTEQNNIEKNTENRLPFDESIECTSQVADATATVIIQHLLSNNHIKSLRSNYTC